MRRFLLPLLSLFVGCHACCVDVPRAVERQVAAVALTRVSLDDVPCSAVLPGPVGPFDLPTLWNLALAHNPTLREAAAEVEATRGQLLQASKYPNPRVAYTEETLGNQQAPAGTLSVQLTQEILTAGKRQLDLAVATRGTDVAALALLGRKFEVLTRIRRAYNDYQNWLYTVRVSEELVTALHQGAEIIRRQVQEIKSRPRADLLRQQALLQEARINLAASRASLDAAWRQLAAEVGLPHLPIPAGEADLAEPVPRWDVDAVLQRVLAANSAIKQAAVEAERAHLEVERARAGAIPNVVVGGGYSHEFVDRVQGGIVSVETALPLWDRQQGRIQEAQARWARAQASQRVSVAQLSRETAEAFGRYQAERQRVEELTTDVLPLLMESLASVREGYRSGSALFTFTDVVSVEQALNDARLRLAAARRALWLAIADLQGLMQLDVGEELGAPGCPPPSQARDVTP